MLNSPFPFVSFQNADCFTPGPCRDSELFPFPVKGYSRQKERKGRTFFLFVHLGNLPQRLPDLHCHRSSNCSPPFFVLPPSSLGESSLVTHARFFFFSSCSALRLPRRSLPILLAKRGDQGFFLVFTSQGLSDFWPIAAVSFSPPDSNCFALPLVDGKSFFTFVFLARLPSDLPL